ncbi:MAG: hypothetical protein HFF10_05525 [Angelakisella sp.]|jgi:hypothetical protein|nr:hypothetical protein [Angelakisella sp.]
MTKKKITEWLESQRDQALHKCQEDHDKQERAYLDAYFKRSGLRNVAGQVQEHLEQALRLWLEWKQAQETGEHLRFSETSYLRLERQLDGFVFKEEATYEQFIKREIILQTKELDKLTTSRREMEKNINQNYSRLIQAVSGMKNTKEAVAYLEKLGFDLSDLDEEKAMAEIDTTYLFPRQPAA